MGDFNTPSVFYFSKESDGFEFGISKPPQGSYFLFRAHQFSAAKTTVFLLCRVRRIFILGYVKANLL